MAPGRCRWHPWAVVARRHTLPIDRTCPLQTSPYASTSSQDTAPIPGVANPPLRQKPRRRRWALSLIICLVVAIPLLFGSLIAAIYWQARTAEAAPSDVIVVLGAAQWNGRPSDVLEARLQRALDLYEEGYAPLIVVTGGNQPGDIYTEGEVGAAWLQQRGVPDDAIVVENTSRSTLGNLEGARTALGERDVRSVLIVSDGFHLFRAKVMARHLGWTAHGVPVTDGPIDTWSGTEFSYVLRETGGVIAFLPELL